MSLSQIKSLITYRQTETPVNPKKGEMWLHTVSQVIKLWKGSEWEIIWGGSAKGSEYGYILGGHIGSYVSGIDRITFPFDSGNSSNVGKLTSARYQGSGCNSSAYGFSSTGNPSSGVYLSNIERIEFPFDSGTASQVGNTSSQKGYIKSGFNCSTYGYVCGGYNGSTDLSTIDRIVFPQDSGTTSQVGSLTAQRYDYAGFNSSEHGFCSAGYRFSGFVTLSNIDRLTFPFDSGTSSITGNLTINCRYPSGCNSSEHGFNMGGSPSTAVSNIERMSFPFDSGTASHVGNLNNTISDACGGINSTIHGFNAGGYSYFSNIERLTFPFNSGTSSITGHLSIGKNGGTGVDGVDFVTQFV